MLIGATPESRKVSAITDSARTSAQDWRDLLPMELEIGELISFPRMVVGGCCPDTTADRRIAERQCGRVMMLAV